MQALISLSYLSFFLKKSVSSVLSFFASGDSSIHIPSSFHLYAVRFPASLYLWQACHALFNRIIWKPASLNSLMSGVVCSNSSPLIGCFVGVLFIFLVFLLVVF